MTSSEPRFAPVIKTARLTLRELGGALMPDAHGRGSASERLAAVLTWVKQVCNVPYLVALIDPDNTLSIQLAEKFGFSERVRSIYKNVPTIQFERRRSA